MEVLEWLLEDKVYNLPFKKLDSLICFVSDYLSSLGDDTEVEHSSSSNESNEGNKNGQIFSPSLEPESICHADCLCNTQFQQHYTILDWICFFVVKSYKSLVIVKQHKVNTLQGARNKGGCGWTSDENWCSWTSD